MKKLVFVAAALAAGTMSFAASAERSDRPTAHLGAAPVLSISGKKASAQKQTAKPAQASKAQRTKAVKQASAGSKPRKASARLAKRMRAKTSIHTASVQRKSVRAASAQSTVKRMTLTLDAKNVTLTALGTVPKELTVKPQVQYATIVSRYATSYGVPVDLAHAVISVESNYRADARGSAGEIGLMQIKPATARMMGYSGSAKGLFNPETNIKYGMKYLGQAHKLGGGATCGTILRYNAGHAARRMNPVSSAYCSKVKRFLAGA